MLFAAFLFPHIPEQVAAEEKGTTAALSIETAVAISIPSEITIEADPEPDGKFQSTSATLGITTNNFTGYDLYLSAADGDNVLRNENPSIQNTINPTTDGKTSTTMSNNTWGYNLSGGSSTQIPDTYNAVPKDGTTALDSTTTPSTTNYNLTFGAKVDTNIASGTYSSEVIISAVAKPVLITINFNGNGATSGSMSPIQVAVGGQVKLPANTYTKTDEVFTPTPRLMKSLLAGTHRLTEGALLTTTKLPILLLLTQVNPILTSPSTLNGVLTSNTCKTSLTPSANPSLLAPTIP